MSLHKFSLETLQWGRRLSTTETSMRHRLRESQCAASMGPSSFNDGNIYLRRMLFDVRPASMGPSSFNDGNLPAAPSKSRPPTSFNGAVVFQRRKLHYRSQYAEVPVWASMGPSSFNDGN
ncbi:MAG: hypothetical protein R3C17_06225 [Planctomycetaceae bacterium]